MKARETSSMTERDEADCKHIMRALSTASSSHTASATKEKFIVEQTRLTQEDTLPGKDEAEYELKLLSISLPAILMYERPFLFSQLHESDVTQEKLVSSNEN